MVLCFHYEMSYNFTTNDGISCNSNQGVLNTKSGRLIGSTDTGPRGFPWYRQQYLSQAATI
jgi:hypothetical protein